MAGRVDIGLLRHPTTLNLILVVAALNASACFDAHHIDEPDVFIDLNLPLDENCRVNIDDADGLSRGLYDISSGSGFCERDYDTRLRLNTFLTVQRKYIDRAGHFAVHVRSAEVTLREQNGHRLTFPEVEPPLLNPFQQVTGVTLSPIGAEGLSRASITIQTIPAGHAGFLGPFVDQTIVADIQLFGFNEYDEDVEFEPFSYPIEICDGCLTICASSSSGEAPAPALCDDDSGQDDRICRDVGC